MVWQLFSPGCVAEFELEWHDLGTLHGVRIGHDNLGRGKTAAWRCQSVNVSVTSAPLCSPPRLQHTWIFAVNQWIGDTKVCDGLLSREISCSSQSSCAVDGDRRAVSNLRAQHAAVSHADEHADERAEEVIEDEMSEEFVHSIHD